jgi:hypothetical protein
MHVVSPLCWQVQRWLTTIGSALLAQEVGRWRITGTLDRLDAHATVSQQRAIDGERRAIKN